MCPRITALRVLFLVTLLAFPAVAASAPRDVLIARVGPALAPSSSDLVEIVLLRDLDLEGFTLDDGEGRWMVSQSQPLAAGSVVRFVFTPGVRVEDGRYAPALTLTPDLLTRERSFALAKSGDVLTVGFLEPLDAFAYGSANVSAGAAWWHGDPVEATSIDGRVFVRQQATDGTWIDTDTAADWTHPRVFHQWQRDRPVGWFDVALEVRAFVCPDRCLEEVVARIDAAKTSIRFNIYDLSHRDVVQSLTAALARGVAVDVLLDPRPVGADARKMDRIAWSVDALNAAGADVRVHGRARFAYDHAKYLVVDDEWSVALSENANPSGWPADGRSGNRGWGAAVHDTALSAYLAGVFDADHADPDDARSVTGIELHPDAEEPVWAHSGLPVGGRLETLVVAGAHVRPMLAPDHLGDPASSPLVATLQGAGASIRFQQLNLPLEWDRAQYATDSPLVAALFDAAERGVAVCGIVDGSFVDGDAATDGNDRTALLLAGSSPRLDVRLGTRSEGIYHNKGWIVDGRYVAVGSANGNLASEALNRELDLLIDHPEIAAFYEDVLLGDLASASVIAAEPACPTPSATVPGPGLMPLLVLVLALVWAPRRVVLNRRVRPDRRQT